MERQEPSEPLLDLNEDEMSPEALDSQVQRAQEQLLHLKRQQDVIEKQKRELEELSRRQEQLQQGRAEMLEKITRAVVVLEREAYDAQKRVEQLHGIHASFTQHLDALDSINPRNWDPEEINRELNKALSAVDDARAEFTRSRPKISDPEAPEGDAMEIADIYEGGAGPAEHDFLYWLKAGFAFTLPLLLLGGLVVFILLNRP